MTAVTWNPADKHANVTLSNGNLTAAGGGVNDCVRATVSKTSGKWYWEITYTGEASLDPKIGVATPAHNLDTDLGQTSTSWAVVGDGRKYHNGSINSYLANIVPGEVIGVALDLDTGKIWWARNNVWGGDPVEGTGAPFTNLPVGGAQIHPAVTVSTNVSVTANFGGSAFAYSPPSGFSAIQPPAVFALSGTVQEGGANAARVVRAYRRDTGALLGETTSNGAAGSFSIDTGGFTGECYVVALDDVAASPDFNALVFDRLIPVQQP